MKAEIKTHRHIICPGCGKDDGFRIDHLDDLPDGHAFGPWSCDQCGTAIRGRTAKPCADIELAPREDRAPALMLLEIGNSTPPVYIVLKDTVWEPENPGSWDLTYFVEEHTCPTNLIPAEAILWDGDEDPHGVLRFVQIIPTPDDFDADQITAWSEWAMLFDKLPGQLIEGSRIMRTLPGPKAEHDRQ